MNKVCFQRGLCSKEEAFLLSTEQPGVRISALPRFFFSLLHSLWTVCRSNPSSAKQLISQLRLAVTSRAKHYKKCIFRLSNASCVQRASRVATTSRFTSDVTLSKMSPQKSNGDDPRSQRLAFCDSYRARVAFLSPYTQ